MRVLTSGLLFNELNQAPAATLEPLVKILTFCQPMLGCTLRSAEAPFVAYIVGLAVDVLAYVHNIMEQLRDAARAPGAVPACTASGAPLLSTLQFYAEALHGQLHGPFKSTLLAWLSEAETEGDTVAACVVHAHLALLWSNLAPADYTADNV
jgi:hypothetical protein